MYKYIYFIFLSSIFSVQHFAGDKDVKQSACQLNVRPHDLRICCCLRCSVNVMKRVEQRASPSRGHAHTDTPTRARPHGHAYTDTPTRTPGGACRRRRCGAVAAHRSTAPWFGLTFGAERSASTRDSRLLQAPFVEGAPPFKTSAIPGNVPTKKTC